MLIKYKNFQTLFKEHLLSQFLTVLLHTLLGKSHNLLNDDIFLGIYNMTSVDFHAFFTTFLPHFLQNIDGILENHKELLQQGFTRETVRIYLSNKTFLINIKTSVIMDKFFIVLFVYNIGCSIENNYYQIC